MDENTTNQNLTDRVPRSFRDLDQQGTQTFSVFRVDGHYHQPRGRYISSSSISTNNMFRTIIADIITHTHFPDARERAQYIVEEMDMARRIMEEHASEANAPNRRQALTPILKAIDDAVRLAKRRAGEMNYEQHMVETYLKEKLEKVMNGEMTQPWQGGSEATKNGWDRPEYAISIRSLRAERKERQSETL